MEYLLHLLILAGIYAMLSQSLNLSAGFGGFRNLWGSAAAAAFLVFLLEALRFVGMPNSVAANARQIIYGGFLIFMMFRHSSFAILK